MINISEMNKILNKITFKLSHIVGTLFNTILFLFTNKNKVLVVNGWMELYGKYPLHQNLGDELNYYLLKELSKRKIFNYKNLYVKCINYCCIGSIIDTLSNSKTIIWGAGLITDETILNIVPLKVCAVRGALTRDYLLAKGIQCPEVYGDPALLLPLIYDSRRISKNERVKKFVGVIPHISDLNNVNVRRFVSYEGVKIIRLCGYKHWHDIIDEINQCDFVISSSLHGVIISDAYNIPNVWVEFSNNVIGNGFKFRDYYSSVRKNIPEPVKILNSTSLEELLGYKKYWEPINIDLNKLLQACPFEIKEKFRNKGNETAKKDGLSGLMRIKNEASFIEGCIDSCIDALDELIIVYNDCTDDTPKIVEKKRMQYPDKIKAYAYNYGVLSHNLTREEFEYVKNLPDDSLRLHCNQCNFALSKANYKYAVKIDADQLYFADELKKWRDVCSRSLHVKWHFSFIFGWLFMMYFTAYRRLSFKYGKPCLWMIPDWFVRILFKPYSDYSKWMLLRGKALIALSGVNVFKDDRWYVTFDGVNIHPPYNGEGDTVIFKVSDHTYWGKYYREDRKPYSVTEVFVDKSCKKHMFSYPVWFHIHANRKYCCDKVKKMKDEHPECFVPIEDFPNMTYRQVLDKMDKKAHTLFQMTLFALIHKIGVDRIRKHLYLLS